jgi:mRNA-degrading endonuclease RelE of RelBE toxin-antitoxin system
VSYNIIPTKRFEKEIKRLAKKYQSIKSEFADLIDLISKNPKSGTYLGNNCYKIRMAISSKGKGKSGGARIITYIYTQSHNNLNTKNKSSLSEQTEAVYLLTILRQKRNIKLKA